MMTEQVATSEDFRLESRTLACDKFLIEHKKIASFIHYVAAMAASLEGQQKVACKTLLEVPPYQNGARVSETDEKWLKEKAKLEKCLNSPHQAMVELQHYRQFMFQLTLSRGVDNYLSYLSELISLIFYAKPQMLISSKETINLSTVLKHENIESLIFEIIEQKVHELSYKGLRELYEYLDDKYNLRLFLEESSLLKAIQIIEYRNLIIHNRAVVNDIFITKLGSIEHSYQKGEQLEFEYVSVMEDLDFLLTSVQQTDKVAIKKFNLSIDIEQKKEFERKQQIKDLACTLSAFKVVSNIKNKS